MVTLGCMHGYNWKPLGEMTNEAFGEPVLAAIGFDGRGYKKVDVNDE